jgi:hypothetical protein
MVLQCNTTLMDSSEKASELGLLSDFDGKTGLTASYSESGAASLGWLDISSLCSAHICRVWRRSDYGVPVFDLSACDPLLETVGTETVRPFCPLAHSFSDTDTCFAASSVFYSWYPFTPPSPLSLTYTTATPYTGKSYGIVTKRLRLPVSSHCCATMLSRRCMSRRTISESWSRGIGCGLWAGCRNAAEVPKLDFYEDRGVD